MQADSGTFTSHPGCLTAVISTLDALAALDSTDFSAVSGRADRMRAGLRRVFDDAGLEVEVTGGSAADNIPSFPIATVRPISKTGGGPMERHWDMESDELQWRDSYLRINMALEGVYVWQGAGVVTHAHTDADVDRMISAYDSFLVGA